MENGLTRLQLTIQFPLPVPAFQAVDVKTMAGPEPELHGFARMVGGGVRALVWMSRVLKRITLGVESILTNVPKFQIYLI